MNYYKNVAPLIVRRLNIEQAEAEGKTYIDKSNTRSLSMSDMYSCFVGLAIVFGITCLLWLLEIWKYLVSGVENDFDRISGHFHLSSVLCLDYKLKIWRRRN